MIKIEVYDNPKVFERYTVLVKNDKSGNDSYGVTIADNPDLHTYIHPLHEVGDNLGEKIDLERLPEEQQKIIFSFLADDLSKGRVTGADFSSEVLGAVFGAISRDRYPPLDIGDV